MIWILGPNGTHLFPTECETSGEASYYRHVIEYWSGDHKLNMASSTADRAKFYLLTAHSLTAIDWKQAKDAIRYKPPQPSLDARFFE